MWELSQKLRIVTATKASGPEPAVGITIGIVDNWK
jgi:hypothetical protein